MSNEEEKKEKDDKNVKKIDLEIEINSNNIDNILSNLKFQDWIKDCVNVDIINFFFTYSKIRDLPSNLFSNPHPLVVEHILKNDGELIRFYDKNIKKINVKAFLSKNMNENVIEWIKRNSDYKWDYKWNGIYDYERKEGKEGKYERYDLENRRNNLDDLFIKDNIYVKTSDFYIKSIRSLLYNEYKDDEKSINYIKNWLLSQPKKTSFKSFYDLSNFKQSSRLDKISPKILEWILPQFSYEDINDICQLFRAASCLSNFSICIKTKTFISEII